MKKLKPIFNFEFLILNCGRFFNRLVRPSFSDLSCVARRAKLEARKLKNQRNSKPSESRFRLSACGFTLVELLIAVAILAIIMPAMVLLLTKTRQSFSADEMHMQLKACNEQTINRVHLSLASNRHIFEGDAAGVSFLGRVQLMAGTPPVLTGSKLPILMSSTTGSLSPNSTGFLPANIGNSIFFLAYDAPQTYLPGAGKPASITTAPATLIANNSSAAPQTVIIDLYRFYYYYLSTTNPHSASSFPSYGLVEWQSIQYADYGQVSGISDSTLMANVSQGLMNQGVSFVVDPTAGAPASLFYDLQSGAYPTSDTARSITQYRYTVFRTPGNGILSGGFWYGISPNSSLWTQQTAAPAKVPLYASASSAFPGGFEVGLSGPNAGREVLLRSVLVAKGSAPKVEVDDMNTVVEARDE
ncbi:MAG TPA: prepilin-type N-terminal cleavage/methylation domain-containing protein [bacterium]|nr:prepilin-type N-terminal cleavage/methylation domain-containing protein [bacterium]